jgi:tetratricopeptide (TPR) repeat protein
VSYYNTYFNISNRYKVGYRNATQSAQENTSDFISVFEYENDAEIFKSVGQFSETAPKLNKLLALRPYNKWIDDALLVEGKIRYLRGEYDSAQLLLQLVVEKYPKGYVSGHLPANKLKGYDNMVKVSGRKKEPIHQPRFKYHFAKNEASIWLIKTLIKRKQYDKALSTIIQTDEDFSFPLQQRKHLVRTRVMYHLAIEDFRGAKEQIEKFFELKNSTKKERGRMRFLLAQIAEKQNDNSTAAHEYTMALKETLSPDLEFEAKLKSLSFNSRNPDEAISSLRSMLRKGSNISNLDKIYLALGNVYLAKKDEKMAIKNYKLGVESCKTDSRKFVMYDKIAQTYYQLSNYLLSANYYDSANTKLPENYPNKKEFARKTEALKKLLREYNLYYENDSILELASLGEDKAIEKIAKQIKKERNEAKELELQKETSLLADDGKAATDKKKPTSNTWYFEDKQLVEKDNATRFYRSN